MLLIRDVFRCKPGKARLLADKLEATIPSMEHEDGFRRCRVLVDYVASYWTVVLEAEATLAQFEHHAATFSRRPDVRQAMEGYMDLVEGGHREIYTIRATGEEGTSDRNKSITHRFVEAFAAGDTAAIEELVADDHVDHNPVPGHRPGRQGVLDAVALYRSGFPDLTVTVEHQVAEGDRVVLYGTLSGTNRGSMMGLPPTGKSVTFPYMDMYRIADGRIAESWHLEDLAGLMRQLGQPPG